MTDPNVQLQTLRSSIDNIDAALVFMLAERFRCTKQVGVLKAEHGMPASDPSREEQQTARLRRLADLKNRALLRINLRHMTLEEVVAEWHIANGQKEENA